MSSNQLLAAALASALGLGVAGMSAVRGKAGRSSKRKGGGSKRVVSSGLGGMNPTNHADLLIKPPDPRNVPRRIPRNIGKMVTWDIFKQNMTIANSGSGLVETNYSFYVTLNPQYATWLTLFDQYCIPQASIEFDSLTPPGQTYSSPVLYTALDFDNASLINTVAAIEEYDSCEVIVMAPEKRHLRSVRPCAKGVTVNTSGSGTSVSELLGPIWIDSASTATVHYGIRSLCNFFNAGSVNVTLTMYTAFRNHI